MLETKKIFIDTEYFVKSGLHFNSSALKSFRELCEKDELFHITTSVVEREVQNKIRLSVKDALGAMQKFKKKARILSNIEDEKIRALFEQFAEEDIYKKADDVFEEFLVGCNTQSIKANKINPEDILSLYFDKKPPFGDGKKKFEFPDALSLFSLKSYLKPNEKLYVVSGDGDLKSFCDSDAQLISIDSLDKALDLFNFHANKRVEQVKQYLLTNKGQTELSIKEYLEDCDVYNVSTWEDAEADGGVSVTHIGDIEPNVIYISDEEAQITFDVDVEYEVTVTGPDFNNGTYDREDGRMYTFGSSSRTKSILSTYSVEIWLYYNCSNGVLENIKENSFHILGISGDIEVDVEENEDEW